jgi:hypothetical protein
MVYTIFVKNGADSPVPGATVTFSRAGTVLTKFKSGADGAVNIDTAFDDGLFQTGVDVTATAPGYSSAGTDADFISQTWTFYLDKACRTGLYLAGGIAGGLLLGSMLSRKRKGRMSGMADGINPNVKTGILVAGGIAVLYYVNKWLGGDATRGHLPDAAAGELDQLKATGIVPTMTPTEAETYASELVAAFDDCGTDMDAVENVFHQMHNRADVLLLIKTYGVRSFKGCFDGDYFSSHTWNLAQAMTAELSNSNFSDVNKILAGNGVNYTF